MQNRPLVIISFLSVLFQQYALGQNVEANKAIAKRYFLEVINQRKTFLVDSIFDKDYQFYGLEDGSKAKGVNNIKNFLPTMFKAFPDVHYTISDIIAENDKVVLIVRVSATHKEEIFGIKPNNGKLNNLSEIFIFRFLDNKIVEFWRQVDFHNLYRQLKGDSL